MNRKKTDRILLILSVISFFLMSTGFLIMRFAPRLVSFEIPDFLVGVIFWTFLLCGILLQFILSRRMKRFADDKETGKSRIGVISFMKNTPGCVADIVCAVSLVALIVSMLMTNGTGDICYVCITVFVFSFCLHCVLNGKVYHYITNQNRTPAKKD